MYNLQQNVETISCYLKVNNIKKKYFLISIEFKIESVYNVINDPGGQKWPTYRRIIRLVLGNSSMGGLGYGW